MNKGKYYEKEIERLACEKHALLRVARAAKAVDGDAYFSMEGGKHFLVDFDIIDRLHEALKALPEGLLEVVK